MDCLDGKTEQHKGKTMNLLKGNGGANNNHKTDFKQSNERTPSGKMPAANKGNTCCNDGPLKPTGKK